MTHNNHSAHNNINRSKSNMQKTRTDSTAKTNNTTTHNNFTHHTIQPNYTNTQHNNKSHILIQFRKVNQTRLNTWQQCIYIYIHPDANTTHNTHTLHNAQNTYKQTRFFVICRSEITIQKQTDTTPSQTFFYIYIYIIKTNLHCLNTKT